MTPIGANGLLAVDWAALPRPIDDGAAEHLNGADVPSCELEATIGDRVNLSTLSGRTVVYAYPMTGQPGTPLPPGWDEIPGARGCTPQSCAYRDLHADLLAAGASHVFGLSTQPTSWQKEAALRLHLPFALLSDDQYALTDALRLPTFDVRDQRLLKRMTLIIDDGRISAVFYPVFPPDRNAGDVLVWLKDNPR
jgi:peroxiredoxin